jgi:DNA-binding response OmpR family regulator
LDLQELIARIYAVLRRASPELEGWRSGMAVIDFTARSAIGDGSSLHLADREFDLLWYLAERCGRIVGRDELLRAVCATPTHQ